MGLVCHCPSIWFNGVCVSSICDWTRCRWFLELWPTDGPRWLQGARPAWGWGGSSRGSLGLCAFCPWNRFRFGLALASFAYGQSAEVDWSSLDIRPCRLSCSAADGRVYAWVEAVVLLLKQDASGVLGEDKIFLRLDNIWSVALEDQCSMAHTVSHMSTSQRTNPKILDLPSVSPTVVSV